MTIAGAESALSFRLDAETMGEFTISSIVSPPLFSSWTFSFPLSGERCSCLGMVGCGGVVTRSPGASSGTELAGAALPAGAAEGMAGAVGAAGIAGDGGAADAAGGVGGAGAAE